MKVILQIEKSPELKQLITSDNRLSKAIPLIGDLEYETRLNNETFFFETIIGQMLSNKSADAITARFYQLCEEKPVAEKVRNLSIDSLRGIGISSQKSNYIIGFSNHIKENPHFLNDLATHDNDTIISRLTSFKGIGPWTAKMYLIFVLDRRDILPYEDGAFMQAFKWLYPDLDYSIDTIINTCSVWKPYTSIAARYLYKLLDSGYTKYPHQFK